MNFRIVRARELKAMSNDYSDHIERLLTAQQAARRSPEVTDEQKYKIATLKPVYQFATQLKEAGLIKDVIDPGVLSGRPNFSDPIVYIPLQETNTRVAVSCQSSHHGSEMVIRGYYSPHFTLRIDLKSKYFSGSHYDNVDGLYADVFAWITDCVADDIGSKPKY